jgi:hypothetical protein
MHCLSPPADLARRTSIATMLTPRRAGPALRGPVLTIGAALATALLTAGCSAKSVGEGTPELPPSCNAFVAKYEQCITASVPSMPQVAKERAAQTRAALEAEAKRATAAPAPVGSSAPGLTALATKCNDNLQRLTTSCGSSRTN